MIDKNPIYDVSYSGKIKFEELTWTPNSYQFGTKEQAEEFLKKIKNNPNYRNVRITD